MEKPESDRVGTVASSEVSGKSHVRILLLTWSNLVEDGRSDDLEDFHLTLKGPMKEPHSSELLDSGRGQNFFFR